MIRKILFLLLMGIGMVNANNIESFYSDHEKIAYSILDRIVKSFFYKYDLEPIGVGGSMNEDVKTLFLGLVCTKDATIDDARKLIVSCANEYIFAINNDKKLIPHLYNYPFNEQNIHLNISFRSPCGNDDEIGRLSSVNIIKGKVLFNVNKTEYTLETVLEESFEEAVRIVGGK